MFKKHLGLVILSILLVSLDIFQKQLFFTILLIYGLLIKFFLSDLLGDRLRKALKIIIWTIFLLITFLLYYSNHYFPKGPMIDTGDVVCQNDGRGPCGEQFIEDTHNLNIPKWAKFFKQSEGNLLWMGLLFAGIVISNNKKTEED